MSVRIAVLPGDGIGPEITAPALEVLSRVGDFDFAEHPFGGASIDAHGTALTDETLAACRDAGAAVIPQGGNTGLVGGITVGDRVTIRLVNGMDQDHPMHHPFHVHGAGRFLILSRDSKPEANLVWKDTVLLRAGETVDILLDVSNPGLWMAHCHIAEHNQAGMMFSFEVAERPAGVRS